MSQSAKSVIVFAPHPDDETCGCGGTIAKRVSEGYEVTVVVLSDGRHAFSKVLGINSDPSPQELKEIRKKEVQKATAILGVKAESLLLLDFEDGTINEQADAVETKVLEVLTKNQPSEIYLPYEKDHHLDHRATNRIVRAAVQKLGISPKMYQYSIVRSHARIGPLVDSFVTLLSGNRTKVDTSEFLTLKARAIQEFKSEVSILTSKQITPILPNIERFLQKEETFFIVNR